MLPLVVAFGVLLHVMYWGLGLAWLAMPRRWGRFWPVLIAPAGLALQSLVVWAGAHTDLRGTDSHAWWSELVPLVLLVAAIVRGRWLAASRRGVGVIRAAYTDLRRFGLVWLLMAASLGLLVLPMLFAAKGLTTTSLGSCDAADYAAGARVLQQFARNDRTGFIGLTEVVQVMSVDNFFDFWLRLNHFTPSALIALNGTVFDCAPHELTGILAAVLLAASLPAVFWVARAVVRYSSVVSLGVTLLYGLSPITWYAVAHVALGQLLAAPAIALVTWAGVAMWRIRLTWRAAAGLAGVLAIGYALILGSYNFIVLVGLVPAVAYAGGLAVWEGEWERFGRWLLGMLAPLAGCGLVFAERVAGLAERLRLFRTYDFGWPIPPLTPEGWLGMVSGPALEPWHWGGLRWGLAAVIVAVLVLSGWRAVRQRRRNAWTAASISAPVLLGYGYLQWRAAQLGTNASYDAYKLFAVFFPELLAAACWWVTLRWSRRITEWLATAGIAALILGCNLVAAGQFFWHLSSPPLLVDGELRQLRRVDAMADVASLNLRVPDMWSRLWANAFLLRKAQYFPTHTYEGRLNTPLRGDWDLEGGLIAIELPDGARRTITPHYALVDTRHPLHVRAEFGSGWHETEQLRRSAERWRWAKSTARLLFENPHPYPLRAEITLDALSRVPREIRLVSADGTPSAPAQVGTERGRVRLPGIELPPGRSELELVSSPPAAAVAGDSRELALCVFRVEVEPGRQ